MGPRSDNRGYGELLSSTPTPATQLQWVHGPRTVVMVDGPQWQAFRVEASMGPRSENRGYDCDWAAACVGERLASMGPRSENRGYVESAGVDP